MSGTGVERSGLLGMHLNKFTVRMGLRHRRAFFLDAFKMKFDGFLDKLKNLFLGFRRRDAARKIRDICSETTWAFLNDNHIMHVSFSLEPGLFQHIVECAGRDIDTGFSRNSSRSRFCWMMELTMAAFLAYLQPPISLDQRNEFFDLHA